MSACLPGSFTRKCIRLSGRTRGALTSLVRIATLCIAGAGLFGVVIETGHCAPQAVVISIGNVSGPGFALNSIRFELKGRELSRATLSVGQAAVLGQTWRDVRVECDRFTLNQASLRCDGGRVVTPTAMPLRFVFDLRSGSGTLSLQPDSSERIDVALTRQHQAVSIDVVFSGLQLVRLKPLLSAVPVIVSKGRADGQLRLRIDDDRNVDGALSLHAREIAFSDEAGLHAGEGVAIEGSARLAGQLDLLAWQIDLLWNEGEVFWDPIYSKAGHRISAKGLLRADTLDIESATLALAGVGEVRASARVVRNPWRVEQAQLRTGTLAVAQAYESYAKPFFANTTLADLRAEGRIKLAFDWTAGRLKSAHIEAENVSIEDKQRRFAAFGVYADVPWQVDAETYARIGMSGAELQRLPIGAIGASLQVLPAGLRAEEIRVPVLSGMLTLRSLRLQSDAADWTLSVGGELTPVPLDALLGFFGLPPMQGSISGRLPRLRYEKSTLAVDGALEIEIFNGTVKLSNLSVASPLGLAPRVYADLQARRLDLDLITKTFSFGHMTGLIDADIDGLELSRWQPVKFDAKIASSPGRYRKRISQTAVRNISALGGAGAAAAIQRSLLRFFDDFGYSRIGISCRLEHDVCRMGGIEDVAQAYVIVKGGGIPAINVFGYNRNVGWNELLTRLKRVVDSNVSPTVR
ncbi:MAG: hypothetical protein ACREUQ_09145 [Burkholderiales bacterium]